MPKTSEMRESKFLKQSDVRSPDGRTKAVLWTIQGVERVNVAKEGAEPEYKWALTFKESDKPLVLNSTNIQLCERIFKSDDTDGWTGKRLVLYVDPTVSYGGQVVGGIRVREPKAAAVAAPPSPVTEELTDDDIPF